MAIKLGTSSVTLKLGTQSATGYLGSAIVTATVPGAPTIVSVVNAGGGMTITFTPPESDGGAAITSYAAYEDGVKVATIEQTTSPLAYGTAASTPEVEIAAINSVGEGPKSNAVTATV